VSGWNGYGNEMNCCTYEGNRYGFDAASADKEETASLRSPVN
jgi:hypothetical protein